MLIDELGDAAFVKPGVGAGVDPFGTTAFAAASTFAVAPGAEHSANKQLHSMHQLQLALPPVAIPVSRNLTLS